MNTNKTSQPHGAQKRLWPMKWVVLSIVIFIGFYTWVMVKYRKPGPSYRPYADSVDRATVTRLLSSGYQKLTVSAERPVDSARSLVLGPSRPVSTRSGPGGLPSEIDVALIEKPTLASAINSVTAAPTCGAHETYRVLFTATMADNRHAVSSAMVFRRGTEITIVPKFETLRGGLEARWKDSSILVEIPPGSFPPGSYAVSVVGQRNSLTWDLTLRQ